MKSQDIRAKTTSKGIHLSEWSWGVWLDHLQVNHSERMIFNQPIKDILMT